MGHLKFVNGFSRWTKREKIAWLREHYLRNKPGSVEKLRLYWHQDEAEQALFDELIENVIGNYYLPFAIAPNFLINGEVYAVPMVTEESSVVAAASKAAKFWYRYGGFRAEVTGKIKTGHIHLIYKGNPLRLYDFFNRHKAEYLKRLKPFTERMDARGGGILSVQLEDQTLHIPGYYVIGFQFDTVDSMGANFINTVLEEWAEYMEEDYAREFGDGNLEIVLRILSNYNPSCKVRVEVQAPVESLETGMAPYEYVQRFKLAVDMARVNIFRAVTHNKGIMNGVDAVVLATGNDFRAVEAGAHAHAVRDGVYRSLSEAEVSDGIFRFGMEIPLALGTVGGMTRLHPMAQVALDILQNPSAEMLMKIVAATGLAQNFSAIHSLVTEGIQKGHMKMHLNNILRQLDATEEERRLLRDYFTNKKVHVKGVKEKLDEIRQKKDENF